MDIKIKNKVYLILIICLTLAWGLFTGCKSSSPEETVFNNYVHPREYYFDLYDIEEDQVLSRDRKTNIYSCTIDFSDFVKHNLPKAGDKIIFKYKVSSARDIPGEIHGSLEMPEGTKTKSHLFASDLKKKEAVEGMISFVLPVDLEEVILKLEYKDKFSSSRMGLTFEKITESTDTEKEQKDFTKAKKKGYKIVDIKTEIVDDYVRKLIIPEPPKEEIIEKPVIPEEPKVPEKTPEEILAEKQARIEAEQARLAEEQAKLEAEKKRIAEEEAERKAIEAKELAAQKEKERQENEMLEHQKMLEETIQTVTSTNVTRYEKEYLNDYAVPGYVFDMDEEEDKKDSLFVNPNKADELGRTLLMYAAKDGNDWKINALIDSGADVNMRDNDGWTALMYAVRYHGNMNCVELLINAGADVKAHNKYGMSALILASNYNSNPDILEKLLGYYSPTDKDVLQSFIQVLTENQDEEYIQLIKVNLFLDKSIPLNSFYQGKTPLMYAAALGHSTNVIKLLLENSSTGIRSKEGKTAFDYAKENPKLKHDDIYWSLNSK